MPRQPYMLIGDWTVIPATSQLTRDGETVHLTPRAMDLLRVLADHAGEVVNLEQLIDEVWADASVTLDSLYRAVGAIRRALDDDPHEPKYLETIPKRGYRLVANVRHMPGRGQGKPGIEAIKRLSGSQSTGARALVALTLVIAASAWILGNANRRSAHTLQPITHVAVITDVSHRAVADETLQQISDRLVERLVRLDGVAITTSDIPVSGGASFAPYAATGRALGADVVLVVRSNYDGNATLDLIDPKSETLRASIPVDTSVSDTNEATNAVIMRLGEELDLPGHWLRMLDSEKLDAREQVSLGRYYMQRRHAEFETGLFVMEKSVAAFQAAANSDPYFVDGLSGLALAWALRFQYETDQSAKNRCLDSGRAAVKRALALDPDSAEAYTAIALFHDYENDALLARATLERAHDLDPDDPMVLRLLSRVLVRLGEFHLAAGYARRSAELAPFSSEHLNNASWASSMVGDFDRAFLFSNAVLELTPSAPGALNNLIVYRRDAGELDKAINLGPRLDRALLQRPDIIFPYLPGMMANLYIQIDAPTSAEALILQAEQDYPNNQYTWWARSSYLLATGNVEAAQAHILDWPLEPDLRNHLDYSHLVAAHATMAGLHDYARQLLEQMPEDNDPLPWANPFLARGKWLHADQLGFAVLPAVYMAFAENKGGNPGVSDGLLAETMEFLNYWIERNVWTSNALYHRAAVHALQGRPDEGVADLAAAVDAGYRYAWRIRIDPVLDGLRGHPDFPIILSELEDELAKQRARIDVPATVVAGVESQ